MKVVILAGGKGTRLAEETNVIPKPMVDVGGGRPILWHIMQIYAAAGFKDFLLALGYKGEVITDYFLRYPSRSADVSVSLATGTTQVNKNHSTDWDVRMVDTGLETLTGGHLLRLQSILRPQGTFMVTYGDGVIDLDINRIVEFHRAHGRLATVTCVRPPARFGAVEFCGDQVQEFREKPRTGEGWINGGFFVFEPEIFDTISGQDETVLESDILPQLADAGELMGFKHEGFWQCVDTLRDKMRLQELWDSGEAPWRRWC